MAEILSAGDTKTSIQKEGLLKSIIESFRALDRFTQGFILTTLLLIAVTPFIVSQYLNTLQEAAEKDKPAVTISLATNSGGFVTFNVTRSISYSKESIWVTNKCWNNNNKLVQDQKSEVNWISDSKLSGSTSPLPTTGGAKCTAYVTLKPWQDKVLNGTIINYIPL